MAGHYTKTTSPNTRLGGFTICIANEAEEGKEPSFTVTGWAGTQVEANWLSTELTYLIEDMFERFEEEDLGLT